MTDVVAVDDGVVDDPAGFAVGILALVELHDIESDLTSINVELIHGGDKDAGAASPVATTSPLGSYVLVMKVKLSRAEVTASVSPVGAAPGEAFAAAGEPDSTLAAAPPPHPDAAATSKASTSSANRTSPLRMAPPPVRPTLRA